MEKSVPVVGLAGYSGSGKTTFLEKLITELKSRGYRLGVIKHTSHQATRPAGLMGADAEVLVSPGSIFINKDLTYAPKPEDVLAMISGVDLILIEGYKRGKWPKLEIFRQGVTERPVIDEEDLLAVVGDVPPGLKGPHYGADDVAGVADLLERVILKKLR
jgi:molybdopterin-guanine dinucleotide biosynthesis protein MobB